MHVAARAITTWLPFLFAGPDGKYGRGGLSAFREPFEREASVEKRMEQAGQGQVDSAHLVAYPLVRPGRLRPVTVEVARADQHLGRVAAVGEPAAEARVDADMHEHSARTQDPGSRSEEHTSELQS